MSHTIAFDVYGTLVDPVEMGRHLEEHLGDCADSFGRLWHEKKVEYAFRRGLMRQYRDFEICTRQALGYCLAVYEIELSDDAQDKLMGKFSQFAAFPDVIDGLAKLARSGHSLAAFSNGTSDSLHELLGNAGILSELHHVVSVDEVASFKPDPNVYQHLVEKTRATVESCWLVSSNPWDVIGAKAAGLKTAWIQRAPEKVFDPWEYQPDLVVSNLIELSEHV